MFLWVNPNCKKVHIEVSSLHHELCTTNHVEFYTTSSFHEMCKLMKTLYLQKPPLELQLYKATQKKH